jgi:predicted dehydrogenase
MLRTLLVGLGRAGAGLHLPVLNRLRQRNPGAPFANHPIVGYDPRADRQADHPGLVRAESLAEAAALTGTEHTVVHVCTPPESRPPVLNRLAELGFRRLLVEKPLSACAADLAEITALRERHRLDVVVVGHWLAAGLSARLREIISSGRHGRLLAIEVDQDKPRFTRALRSPGHTSAFDVEIPHSLTLALDLAGPARLTGAGQSDLVGVGAPVPGLGGAWLTLRHDTGVGTRIRSDLTSPVRRRRVVLRLERASVTAHFPVSEEDDHAQLSAGGEHEVFADDALAAFLADAYDYFAGTTPSPPGGFDLHVAAAQLLDRAKRLTDAREAVRAG